ncbi:TIGR00341 family protein [Spirochaeta africana]|uniref:TIGR00341 family protein n=1 Tax=Spirochaeta africana (strain ATCC 700263 / DSM 8902 / Z-7692) TaxID=889378 RepID=H9UMH0_SPIAZ|nr:TIGR00341 family protein [Spirochaeta africana]AFG38713.1 TIGR00341 family protein [Spirochaeta africana DSM 8902]
MPLRLIDVYLPASAEDSIRDSVADNRNWRILGVWSTDLGDQRCIVKILVDVEQTEAITDHLSGQFSHDESFRIIVMPVETSIPVPRDDESADPEPREKTGPSPGRVSREELYAELQDSARVTPVYITLVLLSTIVAAVGLARSNTAVIIGAMVIAPLLGPTIAMAFAAMLGDGSLARRAGRALGLGLLLAFAVSIPIGMVLNIDPGGTEIALRTEVSALDIVLGLAAGGAGAVSMTAAVPGAVIGVMVAVALLPPLAASGMLLGAGAWQAASGALLLLAINLICIHLSAMLTFLAQGIRPSTWWEARKARTAMLQSLAASVLILLLLAGLLYTAYYRA